MTGRADDALAALIGEMARREAGRVLADAMEEARAQARAVVRDRLVTALLEEMAGATREAVQPAPAVKSAAPPERSDAPSGVYVYGFTGGNPEQVSGLAGIDGSTTYAIADGDLVAVVSDVAGGRHRWGLAADGQPDLDTLVPRLQQHERVLQEILPHTTVLPMRFGTLYPSLAGVRAALAGHAGAIRAGIAGVEGKTEWGLTVTWDSRRVAGEDSPGVADPAGSPGRAYLGRRESEKRRAESLARSRSRVAGGVHGAVGRVASASVVHRLPDRQGADSGEVVLKSSYLVAEADRPRFESVIVDELEAGAPLGLRGELTGPWPPYHFSDLRLEGATR